MMSVMRMTRQRKREEVVNLEKVIYRIIIFTKLPKSLARLMSHYFNTHANAKILLMSTNKQIV